MFIFQFQDHRCCCWNWGWSSLWSWIEQRSRSRRSLLPRHNRRQSMHACRLIGETRDSVVLLAFCRTEHLLECDSTNRSVAMTVKSVVDDTLKRLKTMASFSRHKKSSAEIFQVCQRLSLCRSLSHLMIRFFFLFSCFFFVVFGFRFFIFIFLKKKNRTWSVCRRRRFRWNLSTDVIENIMFCEIKNKNKTKNANSLKYFRRKQKILRK